MDMGSVGRRVFALTGTAVASLALVAGATANGVKSGEIKLKPDRDTFEALADMGIAVKPKGSARFRDGAFAFPATGGDVDPDAAYQGLVGGDGALKLIRESDGAKLKLKNVQFVIHKRKADLGGFADGAFVKLAKVDRYGILSDGNSFDLKMGKATLSRVGAEVLSDTFDFPFRRGIPLGRVAVSAKVTAGQVEE
jgi:hypothetical protein